nr:At-P47 [Andraca theae]
MNFYIILCTFIFHHGFILPTDCMPVKEKSCIQMSPEKESEINTLLEEVTDSLNNIASKHDNIDITVLKIGIESHSDDESEEKETKLQVMVNDCHDNEVDSHDNEESGVVVNQCDSNNNCLTDIGKLPTVHETEHGGVHTEQNKNDGRAPQESNYEIKKPIEDENEKKIQQNKDLNNAEALNEKFSVNREVPTNQKKNDGMASHDTNTRIKEPIVDENGKEIQQNKDINTVVTVTEKYTGNDNTDSDKAVYNERIQKPKIDDDTNTLVVNVRQSPINKISDGTTSISVDKEFKINPMQEDRTITVNGRSVSNIKNDGNPDINVIRRKIDGPSKEFGDKDDKSICTESEFDENNKPEVMVLHLSKKSERILEELKKTRNMDPLFVYVEERRGHKKYVFL